MDPSKSSQTESNPPQGAGDPAGDPAELPDLLKIPPLAKALWLRVVLMLGGVICMALGVAGWLMPVVTGIPFYILGMVLLGMAHPPLGHWINRKERTLSPKVRLLLRPRLRRELKAAKREAEAAAGADHESGERAS